MVSTQKGPTLAVLPVGKDSAPATAKILQPSGWPMPKGYANGMAADGRISLLISATPANGTSPKRK